MNWGSVEKWPVPSFQLCPLLWALRFTAVAAAQDAEAPCHYSTSSITQDGWAESNWKSFHFSWSVHVTEGDYVLINSYSTLVFLLQNPPNNKAKSACDWEKKKKEKRKKGKQSQKCTLQLFPKHLKIVWSDSLTLLHIERSKGIF